MPTIHSSIPAKTKGGLGHRVGKILERKKYQKSRKFKEYEFVAVLASDNKLKSVDDTGIEPVTPTNVKSRLIPV
jgi:hypothetical protein